jgi:hypothetical protein
MSKLIKRSIDYFDKKRIKKNNKKGKKPKGKRRRWRNIIMITDENTWSRVASSLNLFVGNHDFIFLLNFLCLFLGEA